jgi:hypothetical protein
MSLILSGTDGLSDVDGSAATPAIRGTDANTGIFFPAADTIAFSEGGVEAMRLDSAGNAGLSVTPNAWAASWKVLQLQGGFVGGNAVTSQLVASNSYSDGTNWRYVNTGAATQYAQTSGAHSWSIAPSGTAGNTISFTQAMTLDASGNLGVGTSSPQAYTGFTVLTVDNATNGGIVSIRKNGTVYGNISPTSNNMTIDAVQASASIVFRTGSGSDERARITSGGYFKSSNTGAYAGATGNYNEFRSSEASLACLRIDTTSASLTTHIIEAITATTASTGWWFQRMYSGNAADLEFALRGDGNGYADGTWNNNGADYAEFFESATGAALTLGATVVLDGNKVREATDQDPASAIMGVVRPKEPSKASMVVGNTAWNKWANKYLTDDFDRYIMEDHDVFEWEETITDEDGKTSTKQHSYESHRIPAGVTVPDDAVVKTHDDKGNKFQHYKLNPAWNPDAEYVNRENRPEWIIVGLVGQVKVLKGQPVNDRWIKMRDVSATVEEWMIR